MNSEELSQQTRKSTDQEGTETEDNTSFSNADSEIFEKDEDGCPVLTPAYVRHMLQTDLKRYYATPEVNDTLWLLKKGFRYIKCMDMFPELECLYFNGNGCREMTGLETNVKLKSLYLQENAIKKIEGIENLVNLDSLCLYMNYIPKVEGLAGCKKLKNVNLANNRLGENDKG